MRVLITGAGGQVGNELQRTAPTDMEVTALARGDLDITDAAAVHQRVEHLRPHWIINAAAYTQVDRAETEVEAAYQVNKSAVAHLARAAHASGARLMHVSTDFVFDGRQWRPYRPEDAPHPLGIYGKSKYEGEVEARTILGDQAVIVRTSWVYAAHGNNFVKTILRLLNERDLLRVVADQIGTPTWARGLAQALWSALARDLPGGVWHWSDAGVASWYDFAVAIQEEARALGLLGGEVPILPIPAAEYPLPAPRPAFSVLDKDATWSALRIQGMHWRQALRSMMRELV